MTTRDKKQLKILIALVIILGVVFYLAPQLNRPPTVSAVQPEQPGAEAPAAAAPATVTSDARIRIDLVQNSTANGAGGHENLFQYRMAPPPPPRSVAPANPFATSAAAPPSPPAPPPGPPPPPPPPPINLKYQGFARSEGSGITAFLVDDSRHYNVASGDVLMGKYRILSVTDRSVEVEDLLYNRRQTLPLLK